MTTRIAVLALAAALTSPPAALAQTPRKPPPRPSHVAPFAPKGPRNLFVARLEIVRPADSLFRSVYGTPLGFEGELRVPVARQIDVAATFGYTKKTGKTTVTQEPTDFSMYPIEGMLLVNLAPGKISPYIGGGGTAVHYSESNPIGAVSKWTFGFLATGGVTVQATKRFVFDARLKYSYFKGTAEDGDINLGGISVGIGGGIRF